MNCEVGQRTSMAQIWRAAFWGEHGSASPTLTHTRTSPGGKEDTRNWLRTVPSWMKRHSSKGVLVPAPPHAAPICGGKKASLPPTALLTELTATGNEGALRRIKLAASLSLVLRVSQCHTDIPAVTPLQEDCSGSTAVGKAAGGGEAGRCSGMTQTPARKAARGGVKARVLHQTAWLRSPTPPCRPGILMDKSENIPVPVSFSVMQGWCQ